MGIVVFCCKLYAAIRSVAAHNETGVQVRALIVSLRYVSMQIVNVLSKTTESNTSTSSQYEF